jgi:hypothetical protein
MKMFLNEWVGRFGNNLKQLSNAICLAEKTHSSLKFKYHPLIKNQTFDFSRNQRPLKEWYSTFWKDKIYDIVISEKEVEESRSRILKKYILPLLPYDKKDLMYDIVVHLRGGDIWIPGRSHNAYVQCPLSYYEKIFEIEKPQAILLVCEDKSNPVVEKLLHHPRWKCDFQSSSVEKDINTLLNALVLVKGGISTFSDTLAMASLSLQKLYVPAFEYHPGIQERLVKDYFIMEADVVEVQIQDFIKVGKWTASLEQRKQILEHPLEHIHLRTI